VAITIDLASMHRTGLNYFCICYFYIYIPRNTPSDLATLNAFSPRPDQYPTVEWPYVNFQTNGKCACFVQCIRISSNYASIRLLLGIRFPAPLLLRSPKLCKRSPIKYTSSRMRILQPLSMPIITHVAHALTITLRHSG
jgi:hypothetical protein